MDNKGQSYETILENSSGFNNPNNIKYLSDLMGLGQLNYSNMVGLRERFPPNEYSTELRQAQASKWAFRSVAEGIDHFKAGRHSEAFQCLNKALTVDPRNVEGLVARGALYANSGSFKKAIDDFETALKLNPSHANARKYMAETLVALGRSYEDEKKYEDALKAYENCLTIAPYHDEAKNSIEYIKSKTSLPTTITTNPLEPFKSFENENIELDAKKEKKKRKKERKSRSKKRQRWSSSSSSSTGGSSSSSSSSDSSGSSSSSGGSSRSNSHSPGRKKKHKKDHHGSSLSPLSKRMAQYNNPPAASIVSTSTINSHDMLAPTLYTTNYREKEDYEFKVRKFLEQTKDDSDYEDKVRKFLEETARWKREKEKEKKHSESEKKIKKKKKEKKAKDKDKEEKKLRKKKKKEERKKRKKDKLDRVTDLQPSLPDLGDLESKLSAYYAKVEKETAGNKRYSSQYNDMPSPLSNSEKLAESRREEDMRREKDRDDVFKSYHDRDPRMSMPSQRKDSQRKPFPDIFEQETQLIHPEPKMPNLDTSGSMNSKWKAVQSRREPQQQKWQEIAPPEKKMKPIDSEEEDSEMHRPLDKSLNIRKHMQREITEKRAMQQQMAAPTPPASHKESPHKQQTPIKYPTPTPPNKFQNYKDNSLNSMQQQQPQQSSTKFSSLGNKFQPIGQASNSDNKKGASRSDSESDRERRPAGPPPSHKQQPPPPPRRHSRSRSRSGSSSGSSRSRSNRSVRRSRSRSYSNRRSGSYERKYSRSPSGSYSGRSRSRSRSRSYSRSRSRSRSPDRYRKRFNNRPYNNRGTYYKPRFQPFNNQNYRGQQGNNFRNQNRDQRYGYNNQNNQNRFNNRRGGSYHNQRGNHMMNHRGNRMNQRSGGRYFHNNRQGYRDNFRDRRDFRDRRFSRSYSPDPMRKVDEAKEKINKMLEEGETARVRSSRSRSRTRSHSRERSQDRERARRSREREHSRSRSASRDRGRDRDRERMERSSIDHGRHHAEPEREIEEHEMRVEEEEIDYEHWGEEETLEEKSKDDSMPADDVILEDKDDFIQRMKQRSQNVLIKRAIEARTWYRQTTP